MAGYTVKDMMTNFGKLDKFEGHDFRRWQKKMHFLLTTLKVVYVLTKLMPELVDDPTMDAIRISAKWDNDDYICCSGGVLNGDDAGGNMGGARWRWSGSKNLMLVIMIDDESLILERCSTFGKKDELEPRGHILNDMSDSVFDVYTNVESAKEFWDSLESKIFGQYTQHGLKIDESISVSSIIDKLHPSWKDFKHTLKHGKDDLSLVQLGSHLRIEESLRAQDSDKGKGKEVGGPSVNMTEEGKNKHNKKTKVKSGPIRTTVVLIPTRNQSYNVGNVVRLVTSKGIAVVVDAIAWLIYSGATTHVCKDRCLFKTFEPVEDGSVLYMGDEHFAPIHGKGSISLEFSSVTLFNVPKLHKNLVSGPVLNKCGYKQVYESDKYILSMSGVFVGFGYYNNGHVHNKRMLEMSKDDLIPAIDENPEKYTTCNVSRFFCVYSLHAKDEALDKFKIYKTEVELQQNDLIKTLRIHIGGEYYDLLFFQSVRIIHETTTPYTPHQNGVAERKNRALKEMVNFMLSYSGLSEGAVVRLLDPKRKTLGEKGIDCIFVGYAEHSKAYKFYVTEPNDSISINSIIESRDDIFDENHFSSIPRPKYQMCKNFKEMIIMMMYQLRDEEIKLDRNTLTALTYMRILEPIMKLCNLRMLLSGKKQLMMRLIFKRKMKVDGTIDKFKARLVIQGFRQKEGINYFDTYAPVARITTIRLMLALTAIHNLMIHQMDVKTTFSLMGDLDEEVHMKQPKGFVMPCNEHKVFDETKKFLSSRFSMKDMGEAYVILDIKIKRENKGNVITQSHYIEKILKKFNCEDCSLVSTPMDPVEKIKPNTCKPLDQLKYSRAIGCLMYAMTSTRSNIAYVVGRLSARSKGTTYVNMKFSCFKKLGLSFLYVHQWTRTHGL
uniref:Uncharacterized protein n=1 Tax=Tanacetum cinerariifolium TaxID=118510 RepID=A0A6L2LDH4_TANCI|nr:hypothetical protein [Tanacetum cinerariifolium]